MYRSQLLCQLFDCICKSVPSKLKSIGPYNSQRIRKNGIRIECRLIIAPHGIVESETNDRIVQEYSWVNISSIGIDEIDKKSI